MSSTILLVDEIIKKAEATAAAILADANAEYNERIEKTNSELSALKQEAVEKAQEDAKQVLARRLTLAKLDGRKTELDYKQQLIEKVFNECVRKITIATDNIYRDYFTALIVRNCDVDDIVFVAANDAKKLNADFLNAINKKYNLKLTLSSETLPNANGVFLKGKKSDKDLTLQSIVKSARSEAEPKAAKILFK